MFRRMTIEFEHERAVCYDDSPDWVHTEQYLSVFLDTLKHVIGPKDLAMTFRYIESSN
jgi:hypothetical protein